MHPMPPFTRPWAAALAVAMLASGCASVDLGKPYAPPPVRMPEPVAASPAPGALPPSAQVQSQGIAPSQPMGQPLPPVGQSVPVAPPAPLPAPVPVDPTANLVTFTTRLDGASVVPPSASTASAQLDALYDSSSRTLRWKARWSGLSSPITGVRFHAPADYGQNAPAVIIWPGPFGPTYEGRATLRPEQAADLIGGRWYVTVYTGSYPAGELRGQLLVVH